MDLRSGHAYWLLKNGLLQSYPALECDESCEIVIIGGGITGALVAHYLSLASVDVVLLDRRDVGTGSTAASTAMLLYATDHELGDLTEEIGEDKARRVYAVGRDAVKKISTLVEDLGDDCGFERKCSLYLASRESHLKRLRAEHAARIHCGFSSRFLDRESLELRFHLCAPGALLADGEGQIDPYRLTHTLIAAAVNRGVRVYDRTEVEQLIARDERIVCKTNCGRRIVAKRAVFATGYESERFLKRPLGKLLSSFAFITEPLVQAPSWLSKYLLWETNRPYFYLRSTGDSRIICGGADVPYATAHRQDSLIARKTRLLANRLGALLPDVSFEIAFAWGGTFGTTPDGLPYIGCTKEWPGCYFALGYGGNGITLSLRAAEIIRDDYLGITNPDAELFRFDR